MVRLALMAVDVAATVTDDRLLYIVLHPCGHQALFLPDFIERLLLIIFVTRRLDGNYSWPSVRDSREALLSTR
jgi:hypothetical protein